MILASHNSLTYYKPQWYLRPLAWIGRCQSKTIQEQYELGVRYFDIRIKYDDYTAISGHGLLTYNINVLEVIKTIANFNEGCVVRVTLENTKKYYTDRCKFIADCYYWEQMFPDVTFEGGCQKGTWDLLYDFKRKERIHIEEHYWLFNRESKFPLIKFFAKMRNTLLKDAFTTRNCYLMLDFVEL